MFNNFIFSIIATAIIGIIWCSFHYIVILKKNRSFPVIFLFAWLTCFFSIVLSIIFLTSKK